MLARVCVASPLPKLRLALITSRTRVQHPVRASALSGKRCVPCEGEGGALGYMGLCERLTEERCRDLQAELQDGWEVVDRDGIPRLRRPLRTKNFKAALELCDRIGAVAEAEGHHPDLHITNWNQLGVEVTTHARGGLTENDFILAAKIDGIDTTGLLRVKKQKLADM